MAQIGELFVRIGADTSGLERGVRSAESTTNRLARQARVVASRLAVLSGAAAAAGAAIAANLTRQGLEAIDTQAKLARTVDGTIDGLRGLQIAAKDAGIESSQLATSAQMLNARLGEAARGTGTAAASLDRLGLSANELMRMDVDERMAAIADRMQELGFSSAQAQDELRQLGIRNREMALLMTQGGDAIRAARQEVDDFGLSVSEVDAANVERANDAMQRIGRVIEVVRQRLAIALAPVLEHIANLFNEAARESGGFRDQIDRAIQMGVRGFAFMANAIEGVRRVVLLLGQAQATTFAAMVEGALSAAHVVVTGPIEAFNALIRQMNRIPGVDIDELGMSGLGRRIEQELQQAQRVTAEGVDSMRRTLNEPMPSASILDTFDRIQEEARNASEETIHQQRRAAEAMQLEAAPGMPEDEEAAARAREEAERHREQLAERIQRIREANMHEAELADMRHEQTLEKLREALDEELLTQQEYDALKEETEETHQERMAEIRQRGLSELERLQEASGRDQVLAFTAAGNEMLAAAGRINDGLFKAAQIGGAAQAFVATLAGQAEALRLGWPAGPIAAAKIGAQGLGLVAAIRNASKSSASGGGGGTVGAGGVPATPVTNAGTAGGGVDRTFTVEGIQPGQLFTGDTMRGLLREIEEASEDGLTRIRLV